MGGMVGGALPGAADGLPVGFAGGSRVAGYLLEEQIGAGGMAVVFRARDERLHRQVALKVLSPALAADEAFRHRFIRESRAAAAVDDPHIIPVFEADEADGVLFIAMRYVPDGDVRSLVRRVGPLSPGRAAAIISPMASALDAAHGAGLVHRDVKPANMLVDARPGRPDHVYLSDFGLSKDAASSLGVTGSGQFLGTPGYSAPEQMSGKPVDGRADQYSLACVAFELLCGETPFPRDQVTAVIWAHMSEPPPLLTSRQSGLPPAVDGVLVRALAKAPQDRYPSCKEFADALRATFGLPPYNSRSAGAFQADYRRAWQAGPGAAEKNIPAAAAADDAVGSRRAQQAAEPGTGSETVVSRPAGKHEAHHARASRAAPSATVTRPRPAGSPARRVVRRAVRRRQAVIAGFLSLTLVAMAAVGVAVYSMANADQQHTNADQQHADADQQRAIALSRQLAAASLAIDSSDPIAARQLAVASWRVFRTDQANSSIAALLAEQQQDGTLFGSSSVEETFMGGVAFSPDGQLLASADGNGYVRLWNPITGRPVGARLPADPSSLDNYVAAVAFSPDGKLLATADGNGYVRLWNPATGRPVGAPLPADPVRTQPIDSGVADVAFSPDGKLLATADGNGYVRLWNPATGKPVGAPLPADPTRNPNVKIPGVGDVAFSPDGKLLASADSNGYVRLWNPATGQPVRTALPVNINTLTGVVGKVAFSPNGALLATADGNGYVRLWNPATGRPIGAPLPANTSSSGAVTAVAFSPDAELLASADGNGYVRLWNPATGQPVGSPLPVASARNHIPADVADVAFSPDGKLLATADGNGYVRLWNPATGQPVGTPLPVDPVRIPQHVIGGVTGVAFSPDGKLLATADDDGYVRLWNPATGQPVGTPIPADPTRSAQGNFGVTGVAFSPDGKLLASADDDGYVRLWNPATRQPVGIAIPADIGPVNTGVAAVAFSPDSTLLASADSNGFVQSWRVLPFADPYNALCAEVGPPTKAEWIKYAPGNPEPRICS